MAHTSPINVRALEKAKPDIFHEDRFYRSVAAYCNYVDNKNVKDFYMGLVYHINDEMKKNGVVRLPLLGDFALVKQKTKIGWKGTFQGIIEGAYMVKFYPKEAWRQYFSALSKKPGAEGKLDPREKILNYTL